MDSDRNHIIVVPYFPPYDWNNNNKSQRLLYSPFINIIHRALQITESSGVCARDTLFYALTVMIMMMVIR